MYLCFLFNFSFVFAEVIEILGFVNWCICRSSTVINTYSVQSSRSPVACMVLPCSVLPRGPQSVSGECSSTCLAFMSWICILLFALFLVSVLLVNLASQHSRSVLLLEVFSRLERCVSVTCFNFWQQNHRPVLKDPPKWDVVCLSFQCWVGEMGDSLGLTDTLWPTLWVPGQWEMLSKERKKMSLELVHNTQMERRFST